MNLEFTAIKHLAKSKGWELLDHQDNIYLASFIKNKVRLNIYYSRGTVATALNHPKKGRTQLFRKNVSWQLLKKIMENPRVHTNIGYYFKH